MNIIMNWNRLQYISYIDKNSLILNITINPNGTQQHKTAHHAVIEDHCDFLWLSVNI